MALPKLTGSNPETIVIVKDDWTLVAENVNAAKLHNLFGAKTKVWVTYVKTGDAAPADLDVPKWLIPADYSDFKDSATSRDLYVYPVGTDSKITIEA